MKIKQLHLENYGRFEDLTIDFAPTEEKRGNVTVIVGNNGAGKSQILQALAVNLSWFVALLKTDNGEGFDIPEQAIKNNANKVLVKTIVDFGRFNIRNPLGDTKSPWVTTKVREGRINSNDDGIYLMQLRRVAHKYRKMLTDNNNLPLPLVVLYPVERAVLQAVDADVLSNGHDQLKGYFSALDGIGIDFSDFLSWFRNAEDIQNEIYNYSQKEFFKKIQQKIVRISNEKDEIDELLLSGKEFGKGSQKELLVYRNKMNMTLKALSKVFSELDKYNINVFEDSVLNITKNALSIFTDFQNFTIRRKGTPTMIVEKDGEELDVNQLSQGEKSLLALVGDIARRLAILNPSLDNPLQGEGVVMIDEVDLHLHPKWQHDLIDKLVKTFPNVQFILTTHSPHIVSDRNDILVYSLDDGELEEVPNVYGQDVNTVLTKVFDVDIRDSKVEMQLNDIRRAISHKDYKTAEEGIEKLSKKMPSDDLELLKCRLMLAQAKEDKKNKEHDHAND